MNFRETLMEEFTDEEYEAIYLALILAADKWDELSNYIRANGVAADLSNYAKEFREKSERTRELADRVDAIRALRTKKAARP